MTPAPVPRHCRPARVPIGRKGALDCAKPLKRGQVMRSWIVRADNYGSVDHCAKVFGANNSDTMNISARAKEIKAFPVKCERLQEDSTPGAPRGAEWQCSVPCALILTYSGITISTSAYPVENKL